MARSERFELSVKVLAVLAAEPGRMRTSQSIATALDKDAVMVRRTYSLLQKAGWIVQRKGPHGGARLKVRPRQIGIGDVFAATSGDWVSLKDKTSTELMKKVRSAAVRAMNNYTLAEVVRKMHLRNDKC